MNSRFETGPLRISSKRLLSQPSTALVTKLNTPNRCRCLAFRAKRFARLGRRSSCVRRNSIFHGGERPSCGGGVNSYLGVSCARPSGSHRIRAGSLTPTRRSRCQRLCALSKRVASRLIFRASTSRCVDAEPAWNKREDWPSRGRTNVADNRQGAAIENANPLGAGTCDRPSLFEKGQMAFDCSYGQLQIVGDFIQRCRELEPAWTDM